MQFSKLQKYLLVLIGISVILALVFSFFVQTKNYFNWLFAKPSNAVFSYQDMQNFSRQKELKDMEGFKIKDLNNDVSWYKIDVSRLDNLNKAQLEKDLPIVFKDYTKYDTLNFLYNKKQNKYYFIDLELNDLLLTQLKNQEVLLLAVENKIWYIPLDLVNEWWQEEIQIDKKLNYQFLSKLRSRYPNFINIYGNFPIKELIFDVEPEFSSITNIYLENGNNLILVGTANGSSTEDYKIIEISLDNFFNGISPSIVYKNSFLTGIRKEVEAKYLEDTQGVLFRRDFMDFIDRAFQKDDNSFKNLPEIRYKLDLVNRENALVVVDYLGQSLWVYRDGKFNQLKELDENSKVIFDCNFKYCAVIDTTTYKLYIFEIEQEWKMKEAKLTDKDFSPSLVENVFNSQKKAIIIEDKQIKIWQGSGYKDLFLVE